MRTAKALKAALGNPNHMCNRCDFEEQRKIGHSSLGLKKESLLLAAKPMYDALVEILKCGITPATKENAEIALLIAEKDRF